MESHSMSSGPNRLRDRPEAGAAESNEAAVAVLSRLVEDDQRVQSEAGAGWRLREGRFVAVADPLRQCAAGLRAVLVVDRPFLGLLHGRRDRGEQETDRGQVMSAHALRASTVRR